MGRLIRDPFGGRPPDLLSPAIHVQTSYVDGGWEEVRRTPSKGPLLVRLEVHKKFAEQFEIIKAYVDHALLMKFNRVGSIDTKIWCREHKKMLYLVLNADQLNTVHDNKND